MTETRFSRATAGCLAIGGVAVLIALAGAAPASAQMSSRDGANLLRAVEDGERDCGDLSRADFEAVGEHVMERMVGSAAAHESMDEAMERMMGRSATRRMHESLGRRFTDCGGGRGLAGAAGMMGMMGAGPGFGGFGGSADFGTMMGRFSGARYDGDGDGWSTAATIMTTLMGLLLVLVALGLWRLAPRRPGRQSALEILDRRFAAGELDGEDYARRRQALERAP